MEENKGQSGGAEPSNGNSSTESSDPIQPAVGWHADDYQPQVIHSEHGQPTSIRRSIHRTSTASHSVSNGDGNGSNGDMAWNEVGVQQGVHPGDRYVRHMRLSQRGEERLGDSTMVATDDVKALGPLSRFGRTLFGKPLATSEAAHERLTKVKALAVLSSDALSSVAYATERITSTLLVAGATYVIGLSFWIALAVVVLLLIVAFSYRQTIYAYPRGGGSYIVSKENLGQNFGLLAGASLMIGYILTVAVSVSAGVDAIASAYSPAVSYKVPLAILFVVIITIINLRGVKESGAIFAAPTYAFILGVVIMVGIGIFQVVTGVGFTQEPASNYLNGGRVVETLGIFLLLQAFASGSSALTGVEAIADGVPAFQKPEAKNAAITLTAMASILGFMFLGITFLASQFHILGMNNQKQTVIDQVARHVYGDGVFYIFFVVATTLILILAANTCYSDFPRVAYFLARDKFLPNQFSFRGDRLAFNSGIITLSIIASVLVVIFGADTESLVPLYTNGVFMSFTLSQAGMVMKWWREKQPGWQRNMTINGIGATITLLVLLIVTITRFNNPEGDVVFTVGDFTLHQGTWLMLIILPFMVWLFRAIHKHYARVATALSSAQGKVDEIVAHMRQDVRHIAIVPISSVNIASIQTIAYATSLFPKVIAVHATDDLESAEKLKQKWSQYFSDSDVRLTVLETPFRSLVRPLISFVEDVQRRYPDRALTVVLPEFVAERWWEQILHTQTAARLKLALLFHPDIIVTSVPYHIGKPTNILGEEDADPNFPLRQPDAKAKEEQPAARRV